MDASDDHDEESTEVEDDDDDESEGDDGPALDTDASLLGGHRSDFVSLLIFSLH